MNEKIQQPQESEIEFTLGKGNHSSICGGVTPMRVENTPDEVSSDPVDNSSPDSGQTALVE
jgi:hypothetical protein